jgi:NAD(P)-dependent dehydrogenase (short-subunit alcohol dehydrogenase family)
MNLVVGACGLTGTEVCRELAKGGKQVRALVRSSTDPKKQETLKSLGVSLAYGDLKDPSSLEGACRDVSTVISTASSTLSRTAGDSIETSWMRIPPYKFGNAAGPERGAPASREEEQLLCVKRPWPGHQLARRHPPRWLRELWPR